MLCNVGNNCYKNEEKGPLKYNFTKKLVSLDPR